MMCNIHMYKYMYDVFTYLFNIHVTTSMNIYIYTYLHERVHKLFVSKTLRSGGHRPIGMSLFYYVFRVCFDHVLRVHCSFCYVYVLVQYHAGFTLCYVWYHTIPFGSVLFHKTTQQSLRFPIWNLFCNQHRCGLCVARSLESCIHLSLQAN